MTIRELLLDLCKDFSDTGKQGSKMQKAADALFNFSIISTIDVRPADDPGPDNKQLDEAGLRYSRATGLATDLAAAQKAILHNLTIILELVMSLGLDDIDIDIDEYANITEVIYTKG